MPWLFALVGLVIIIVIGLLVVGRETQRLATSSRPAVFDLAEAVLFIADLLPSGTQGRMSHDDVRWVLLADAGHLEQASLEDPTEAIATTDDPTMPVDPLHVVDETDAVARILAMADRADRDLEDEDIVAVLDGRLRYLEAIGAVGPQV